MKRLINRIVFTGVMTLILTGWTYLIRSGGNVKIVGAMRNVMWKGQLAGTINLDTIANKQHLYGLGPLEYLKGELLIIDGRSYQSTVLTDSTMKVEETWTVKAPFFVYANVDDWVEHDLPDSVNGIGSLEKYIDHLTVKASRPFAFRLKGTIKKASIHIVNLPEGTKVNSPEKAHKGQKNFYLQDEDCEMVGFFSTEHQSVFTHHDTYLHLHLVTSDRKKMGHLDEVLFEPRKMKLYLPR